MSTCPLYLHFLDRELGNSVGFSLTEPVAELLLKILLLGNRSQLYAGLSLAWENAAMTNNFPAFLALLMQAQVLDLVSNHSTLDEFLETRISLYEHDSKRYPMYFNSAVRDKRAGLIPTSNKRTSATRELAREIASWSLGGQSESANDKDLDIAIRTSISDTLVRRDDRAVTYTLFAPALVENRVNARVEGTLRRRISSGYTRHYMSFANADIPTGISGLEYFDVLAEHFPLFDVFLLNLLLRAIGHSDALSQPWKQHETFWGMAAEWRGSVEHIRFHNDLTALLAASYAVVIDSAGGKAQLHEPYSIRHAVASRLRSAIAAGTGSGAAKAGNIETSGLVLRSIIRILQRDRAFAKHWELVLAERGGDACDVLIVTTTPVERDTFLQSAERLTGNRHDVIFGKRRTYLDLDIIGGARVFLVQTEMGSTAPGASLATVSDAIDDLKPKYVLQVGIAFGVDPSKQAIGNILVSHQLQAYELQRIGTNAKGKPKIELRGDRVTCSTKILGRLRAATADWTDHEVSFGLLISGEKLVDNIDFRDQLTDLVPGALGGEMEAAGVYTAAAERQVDWIVAKAICDWADGKKRFKKAERQLQAASAASSFVLHALRQGGFSQGARTNIII